jgi:hypothetical protein
MDRSSAEESLSQENPSAIAGTSYEDNKKLNDCSNKDCSQTKNLERHEVSEDGTSSFVTESSKLQIRGELRYSKSVNLMKEMFNLLRENDKMLGGKVVATIATFLFSICLAVLAVTIRAIIQNLGVLIPSGVLFGSIGTLIMSCVVLASYILVPSCRKHSNILLIHRGYVHTIVMIDTSVY